jgi:hypothetical protein
MQLNEMPEGLDLMNLAAHSEEDRAAELLQLKTNIHDVDIELLFNFDRYLVPMDAGQGLEVL